MKGHCQLSARSHPTGSLALLGQIQILRVQILKGSGEKKKVHAIPRPLNRINSAGLRPLVQGLNRARIAGFQFRRTAH